MNKLELLRYLDSLDGVLIGQHLAYSLDEAIVGYNDLVGGLYQDTGEYPALIGVDMATGQDFATVNYLLIDWHRSGGIVSVDWMPTNPWTGGDCTDTQRDGDLTDLLTPDTVSGQAFHAQLYELYRRLKPLYEAGVPVLFRPLHECTFTDSFWWDCEGYWDAGYHSQPFIELWRYLHGYLAEYTNLIWVYCAANTDEWVPLDAVYPGGEYVDVVGVDVYSDQPVIIGDGYNRLLALGKPVAMCEIGPYHMSGAVSAMDALQYVRDNYPAIKYVQWWHSWEGHKAALVHQTDYAQVMQAAYTITRGDIMSNGGDIVGLVDDIRARVQELRTQAEKLRQAADELATEASAIETIADKLETADKLADDLAAAL